MSALLSAYQADNPTHYWRCADPGGSAITDIGSSPQTAYFSNTTPALGYSGPASDGGSCYFTGGGYANTPSNFTIAPPLTVEVWTFSNAFGASGGWAASVAGFKVGYDLNGQEQATINGFAYQPHSASVTLGHWHQLVFVVTTTTLTLYIDGALNASTSHAAGSQTNAGVIGSDGSTNLIGFCSEVALFPSALSLSRINAHWTAADNTGVLPQYNAGGIINPSTGTYTTIATLCADILAAVQKTFPST